MQLLKREGGLDIYQDKNTTVFVHKESYRAFRVMFANPGFLVMGMEAIGVKDHQFMNYQKVFEKELATDKQVGEFIADMIATDSWSEI
jgi:hypothetical protein